jgi:glycosyltransferase involved in cell wall biosynthesis
MGVIKNYVRKMMNQNWCADKELDVSVVIPAYNEGSGDYLNKAIKSALNQGKRPYEVIVVDDGSTDNTSAIAKEYESKGVKVYKIPHCGISSARNYGAKMARGDVVVFMDADSMMDDGLLDRVEQSIRSGYEGGTCRSLPDSYGASESTIFNLANTFSDVSSTINKLTGRKASFCTGGLIFSRRDKMNEIESKYGSIFPQGRSQDKAFTWRMDGPIDRINDNGIVTSARRVRHDGFIGTVLDRIDRYRTGPGQPYAPDIREGGEVAA